MTIDQDDVIRIMKIMDESDYDELHLEIGDLKLHLSKSGTGGLAPAKITESISSVESRGFSTSAPTVAAAPLPSTGTKDAGADHIEEDKGKKIVTNGLTPITSPLLGCFYCSAKPGAPPFVEVGGRVAKDDTVCLIEVMKTFTTVKAGVEGRIVKICAENAQMVEYQQTLFLVEPA